MCVCVVCEQQGALTELLRAQLEAGDEQRQGLAGDDGVFDGHTQLLHTDARLQRGGLALTARAAVAA